MKYAQFWLAVIACVLAACGGGSADSSRSTDPALRASTSATATYNNNNIPAAADTYLEGEAHTAVLGAETESAAGSGTARPMSAATADTIATIAASAASAATLALPVDGTTAIKSDFEEDFSNIASNWSVNWWGSSRPGWSASRETRAGYTYTGNGAQRYRVDSLPDGGGAHLIYVYPFKKGINYQASVYLRADTTTEVELQIRRNAHPYNVVASKKVTLGMGWQRVELSTLYGYPDSGALRIIPYQLGANIYIDEMSITPSASYTDGRSPGINLPAAGGNSIESVTVKSTSMDEPYVKYAPGWYFNSFGYTSTPIFSIARETRPSYVYKGSASMKFEVNDKKGGDVHLISTYPFEKGKTYRASLYARAESPTPIQAFIRVDAHPYMPIASSKVTLGSTWQRIDLEGVYSSSSPGSVRIGLANASGTIWVDEMTIWEVVKNDLAPVNTETIPDTLFGMHVNKLGVHFNWPGANTKAIRLWNTGTTWRDLEKSKGEWNFSRLDAYVDYATRNDPSAQILYTLGQPPAWASSTPGVMGALGAGASGAPKDMSDWRNYVRTLARRYAGRIRHWELWNEPDYAATYSGSVMQLVEMARIAKEELKSADPANQLVGPGYTLGQGIPALDAFLYAGGGNYVDAIGFHWYYYNNPEQIALSIENVRTVMKTYGVNTKPLWNTEGAFICAPAVTDCTTAKPNTAESASVNARAMFLMAVKGLTNFNYYTWEAPGAFQKLVEGDYVTPTLAGQRFDAAKSWARGSKIYDAYRVGDTVYVVRLTRSTGENVVVLWSTTAGTVVNLPSAWNVTQVEGLDGQRSSISSSRQLTLGLEPVMLRP